MVVPTKKAHILLAHAADVGKQHQLHEVSKSTPSLSISTLLQIQLLTEQITRSQHLFKAYFTDVKNITDEAVLRALAEEAGMDGGKAIASLKKPEMVSTYEQEVGEAIRKGI